MPLLYLGASLVVFGPVWLNLDSTVVGQDDIDSGAIIWLYAWWPHAVFDGSNPLITDAIFVPEGYNLAWSPAHVGPAILTHAGHAAVRRRRFRSTSSCCLSPPLSAWAAYALCRHVTGSVWPAVLGGLLFGFSPNLLGAMRGSAPNFSLVALLPLMVLLVIKRTEGSLSARRFVALMTLALVAQLITGSEVLAAATLFALFAFAIAMLVMPEQRRVMVRTLGLLAVSYALAGLVLTPLLLTMLEPHVSPEHANPRTFVQRPVRPVRPG